MRAHCRVDRSEMEHHHSWISQSVIYIGIELPGQLKRKNKRKNLMIPPLDNINGGSKLKRKRIGNGRKNLMIKEWVLSPIWQYQWSLSQDTITHFLEQSKVFANIIFQTSSFYIFCLFFKNGFVKLNNLWVDVNLRTDEKYCPFIVMLLQQYYI